MKLEASISHLYVHVPFCPAKCPYCAFVTHVGSLKLLDPYLIALQREAEMVRRAHPGGPLTTVYFGGGTPSLMSPQQLEVLLAHLHRTFGLSAGCEITLEGHPDTIDRAKLLGFRAAGVTRLSLGGESLQPDELARIGRRHSPQRVLEVVELARQAGFDNINVDFMYGLPGQTVESWDATLREVLTVRPEHLSLYPLSIEPKTVFARRYRQHQLAVPDDEGVAAMYQLACRRLSQAGYRHYEVANWTQPGHESHHNLAYWHNREFYAIGTGAHGYIYPYRTENITQTRRYIDMVMDGKDPAQRIEEVDRAGELAETVMLRLRLLQEGLDLNEMRCRFGVDVMDQFTPVVVDLSKAGLLDVSGETLRLPEEVVPVANEVWRRFMMPSI